MTFYIKDFRIYGRPGRGGWRKGLGKGGEGEGGATAASPHDVTVAGREVGEGLMRGWGRG